MMTETAKTIEVHDTIRLKSADERHDSVIYIEKNDTIRIEHWRTWRTTDTIYKTIAMHDTIRVSTVRTIEEESKKSPFKSILIGSLIGIAIAAIVIIYIKR